MDIKYTQNVFKSSNSVNNITYYILQPTDQEIKGILQISHGMCEYFSRYMNFVKFMCYKGFVVCGNDHLGHGLSVKSPKEYGFFSHKNGPSHMVQDMYTLTSIMKERFSDNIPYFILGHSMGSLITRLYINNPDFSSTCLSGVILVGTIGPVCLSHVGKNITRSVIRSKGPMYRSTSLNYAFFGNCNRKIKNAKTEHDWLCTDVKVVDLYNNDDKCNFIFTATGFRDLISLVQNSNSIDAYKKVSKSLPMLILSGANDAIGRYGKGPKQVFSLYKRHHLKDVSIKLYPNGRHEMLNEINKDEVYDDLYKWITGHIN